MVRYKLTKNQHHSFQNISQESYSSFVTYGKIGLCHGVIKSTKILPKKNSYNSIIYGPTYYTKKIYENFKQDKSRINTLGIELSKEEISPSNDMIEYRGDSNDIELSGRTTGKRKALNNGIFKADDIY